MSLDAMRWAFGIPNLRSSVKFVLVALADRANEENECYPSREQLQLDTCLNKETISKATEELERLGLLVKVRRFNGSTVYKLIGVAMRHQSAEKPVSRKTGSPVSRKTRHQSAEKPAIDEPKNRLLTYQLTTIEPKNKIHGDEYAADFLKFWSDWPDGFGAKGSKAEAYREWQRVRGRPDVGVLIEAAKNQADEKTQMQRRGVFVAPFKHVCRWIKAREWENDFVRVERRLAI